MVEKFSMPRNILFNLSAVRVKVLVIVKIVLVSILLHFIQFTVNMSDTGSKIFTVKLSPINLGAGINVG
jgi:hypothetical protein